MTQPLRSFVIAVLFVCGAIQLQAQCTASPPINLGPDTAICEGQIYTLGVDSTAYITYMWSTGDSADTIGVVAPDTISLIVLDSAGCTDTATVILSVKPVSPPVDLGPDPTICPNDSVQLGVDPSYNLVFWSTGSTADTIWAFAGDSLSVAVIDTQGCADGDIIEINATQLNPPLTLRDTSICPGQTVVLDAGAGYLAYQWDNGSTSQTRAVTAEGTYTVTVWDASCSETGTITVGPGTPPTVELGPDQDACIGDTVILDAGPGYSYLWPDSTTDQDLYVTNSGTYWVRVRNIENCVAYDTVNLNFYPYPNVSICCDTAFCDGGSASLDAGGPYDQYTWMPTGATTQSVTVSNAGIYWVIASNGPGCRDTSNMVTVTVWPIPTVTITADGPVLTSSAADTYQWFFEGNPIPGANAQTYTATEPGNYCVEVDDANNCGPAKSSEVTVVIELVQENFPEFFSPNGDGVNDVFIIENLDFIQTGNTLSVFNRWGNAVYEAVDYSNTVDPWDGKNTKGKQDLPDGTYFYIFELEDGSQQFKGTIQIHR